MRHYYNAFCFLTLVGVFIIFSHLNWTSIKVNADKNWIDGEQAHAIEKQYDKNFGLHEFSINFWAAINYSLFKEGNEGVIIGKDEWLFTQEEYNDTPITTPAVNQRLNSILDIKKQIEADKGKLIITVIPAKSRVYEDLLSKPLPEHAKNRYTEFISWLEAHNIAHIGLLSTLEPSHAQPTFIRNDTHWSPFGASLSAQKISKYLQDFYPHQYKWSSERFVTQKQQAQQAFKGDLLNFIPVSPYFDFLTPQKPNIDLYETLDTQEVDLFSDIDYNAILVGTSYSAKPEWNFVGALQQHTGLDILNMSQEGHGPFKPMTDYLASAEYLANKSKLIIWEIPERYLVISTHSNQENIQ